jgi:hypothetical protein
VGHRRTSARGPARRARAVRGARYLAVARSRGPACRLNAGLARRLASPAFGLEQPDLTPDLLAAGACLDAWAGDRYFAKVKLGRHRAAAMLTPLDVRLPVRRALLSATLEVSSPSPSESRWCHGQWFAERARARMEAGDFARARHDLEVALAFRPDDGATWQNLLTVCLGRDAQAVARARARLAR